MEQQSSIAERAADIAKQAGDLAADAARLAGDTVMVMGQTDGAAQAGGGEFMFLFTVFVLACFVGYYVVWSVTPALHSPLMGVTNAISSVIIVGGILAAGPEGMEFSQIAGFIAVTLASVNIFGGFIVTQRMLSMFKKKK